MSVLDIIDAAIHLHQSWATLAARAGTSLDRLMDTGGWSLMSKPLRYVESAKIANEGVRLE